LSDRAVLPSAFIDRTAPSGKPRIFSYYRTARPRRQFAFGLRRSPMSFQNVLRP
jgi:hypothetical protein